MMRTANAADQKTMSKAMAMFACAGTAAASILIIRTLSILLGVLLVLGLLLSVLVLRRSKPLTEWAH